MDSPQVVYLHEGKEGKKRGLNSQFLLFGDRKIETKTFKITRSSTCFLWFTINWVKVSIISSLKMLKWKMGEFQTVKGKDGRLLGVKLTPFSNRLGRAGCTVGRCQGGFKKSPHNYSPLFSELQVQTSIAASLRSLDAIAYFYCWISEKILLLSCCLAQLLLSWDTTTVESWFSKRVVLLP